MDSVNINTSSVLVGGSAKVTATFGLPTECKAKFSADPSGAVNFTGSNPAGTGGGKKASTNVKIKKRPKNGTVTINAVPDEKGCNRYPVSDTVDIVLPPNNCDPEGIELTNAKNESNDLTPEDYTPVGKEVDGDEFEIEKTRINGEVTGDKVTLKAKGSSGSNHTFVWRTGKDSVLEIDGSKTGKEITLKNPSETGGDNTVCVHCVENTTTALPENCEGADLETTIHVNNNNGKIARLGPEVLGRNWVHIGETITLEAGGVDPDWTNGDRDKGKDNIDLKETQWTEPAGFKRLQPVLGDTGKKLKLKANDKPSSQKTVRAVFTDKNAVYKPRQDSEFNGGFEDEENVVYHQLGKFLVGVRLDITADASDDSKDKQLPPIEVTEKDDEGEEKFVTIGELKTKVEADGFDSGEKKDVESISYTGNWEAFSRPSQAEFNRPIKATLTAEGSANATGGVKDDDAEGPDDVTIGLSLGFNAGPAGGSVSISETIDIPQYEEGVAVMSAGFQSEISGFGVTDPDGESLKMKSSEYKNSGPTCGRLSFKIKDSPLNISKQKSPVVLSDGESVVAGAAYKASSRVRGTEFEQCERTTVCRGPRPSCYKKTIPNEYQEAAKARVIRPNVTFGVEDVKLGEKASGE